MIDRNTAEKIKNAADIVEVVSDYVHLIKRGSNYMGLCPFHNERTPSFSVNPRRNFCYCFSCHKGGSPVNFIMEKEGVSYHDALLQLAAKYGIEVEERELTDEERARMTRREAMLVASEWAMKQMHTNLLETAEGRSVGLSYLYGRGVTEESVRKYMLGYSIDSGHAMLDAARKAGFDLQVLADIGLLGKRSDGSLYDRFRGRVIFPIRNSSGKVVAFGGRDLKGGPAKYINSPETELYKKSNELYGIYEAKGAIVRQDKCFLMEGYLDVIGSSQGGVGNCVASSGTALTDNQINLIHRFTENVTVVYDGDAAGIKAALRGIDMLLKHKMQVRVLLLPDGDDPDSFARKHTPEEFQQYLCDHEQDFIRFKAEVLMREAGDDTQARTRAVMSVVESIASIPNDVERNLYIQQCSYILSVDENAVARAVATARQNVMEQLRIERLRKNIGSENGPSDTQLRGNLSTGNPPADPSSSGTGLATAGRNFGFRRSNPLEALEKAIVKLCVRYGYVDFCETVDENDNPVTLNVIEYVNADLAGDDIGFSVAGFSKVTDILMENLQRFRQGLDDFTRDIDEAHRKEHAEQVEIMARGAQSLAEIQRLEKTLDERLERERHEALTDYARKYSADLLSNHEDDEVRRISNSLIHEPYQLSNIYKRSTQAPSVEEELNQNVPRALLELKAEIMNSRVREQLAILRKAASEKDDDLIQHTQIEIATLTAKRNEINRMLGERTIYPGKIR